MLINASFECSAGVNDVPAAQGGVMKIHKGWTLRVLNGTPWANSASMHFNHGNCGGGAHVEKIEGNDSLVVFAHDLEWTDRPGKPFDMAVYQQVQVTPGQAYSFSGWMLSLCGGSTMPNDAPNGYYMAKMLGMDPTGGVDPLASTVQWVEDRRNFVENNQRVGWVHQMMATVAQSNTLTLFARINSPFQWHGNHAFIDALSLVEAPVGRLTSLPGHVPGQGVEVSWDGSQSPMIGAIPAGTYRLYLDVQAKVGDDGAWQDWLIGQDPGRASYVISTTNPVAISFRVRARSQQPPPPPQGAWPNTRYTGAWSEAQRVLFNTAAPPVTPPPVTPPVTPPPVAPPSPSQPATLQEALIRTAAARQVIQFNPNAALQKRIFGDHFVPNSPEFDLTHQGVDYIAQRAEHLGSGEVRVYYVPVGDWGNVRFLVV